MGLSVSQPQMLATYKTLIEEYKLKASALMWQLQVFSLLQDSVQPSYAETSPSVM
jgi:hypothetical protein